jgi:hypothetical protein
MMILTARHPNEAEEVVKVEVEVETSGIWYLISGIRYPTYHPDHSSKLHICENPKNQGGEVAIVT